ncbi:hypothetical protein BSLG_006029 [Batrachochytrium salamandrivorans]|nr:hypothetical protein BSLG_006029 [Batrachochytrium salamandrivorans]
MRTIEITKSSLYNGLQAVVISDPSTDKAAAAMDVHVGHLCDPEGVAGLAHFCEHLLFMGTEKFLSEHGGQSNAFTSAENTNYHFEVSASNLEGALDRFAQFFICPLFLNQAQIVNSMLANIMKLAVVGKAELQKKSCQASQGDSHTNFNLSCADTRKLYKCSPSQYASHLIGHESNGSILSLLKKKGWAHGLTAGNSGMGARGFEFMRIIVELTETGLENYEDIIEIIFSVYCFDQKHLIEEWIFHEAQAVTSIAFRFKEKSSPFAYASTLAKNLQLYEPQDVISGSYLLEYLDRDAIKADLSFLKPDSFRTMIVSPNFDTTGWAEANYYGTKYSVKDFTESLKSVFEHQVEL